MTKIESRTSATSPSPRAERGPRGEVDPRIIAVDWSGATRGAEKKIWLAEVSRGTLVRLEWGRSRQQIAAHLIDLARETKALIAGLDFAFSMPAWFVAALDCADAPSLWTRIAEGDGERLLAACAPPFWGRHGRRRPSIEGDELRVTDRALACAGPARDSRVVSAKSVFQIGGAGAVGTASLRGMGTLLALRDAGFAIWPFDEPRLPLVVEIYPRIFSGVMNKSDPAARRARLQRDRHRIQPQLLELAHGSDDAFDAAVSALGMWDDRDSLLALPAATDAHQRIEGAIWHPARLVETT